ncbi:MAG: PhoU domain-containing protein [Candidatus Methanomethylicia archaeon]
MKFIIRIIDSKLREISAVIHKMGDLAYQAISIAIKENFYNGNSYHKIKEISDILLTLNDQIEDKAFEIIARFQPVASDLRTIKSYMKISYDFTRLGRYALDISYVNKHFGGLKGCNGWIFSYTMEMSEKVLNTIKISIEALKKQNIEIAKSISEIEKDIDKIYFEFLDKIIEEKNVESRIIVSSILTIRHLERIADHATYICESIIYALTGVKEFLR